MSGSTRACPECQSDVPASATFCPRCGAILTQVRGSVGQGAAVSGAGWPGSAGGLVAGPTGMSGVDVAPPGLRVASWLIEIVVMYAVVMLTLVVVGAFAGSVRDTGGAVAFLVALLWLPQLATAAWGIVVWVWEGRTGNRVGNLVTKTRTVDASTGRPPGLGKVFLSRLVLGAVVLGVMLVGGLLASGAGGGPGARTVVSLITIAASAAAAGTGVFDKGPLRQGWHEKASGTTVIRSASPSGRRASSTSAGALPSAAPGVAAPGGQVSSAPTAPPVPALLRTPVPPPTKVPVAFVEPVPRDAPIVASPAPPVAPEPIGAFSPPPPHAAPDPGGLIVDVPGFERSGVVLGLAPSGASVPGTPVGDDDDIEHTRITKRPGAPTAPRIVFDTGEVLHVSGTGLVGRAPQPAPGETAEHLVPIDDPDRSISKTHLAFGVDDAGLWVEDKGSTNGTNLITDGAAPVRMLPHERVHVPDRATVRFGERSFTVGRA